jgi:molybdate transport system permease protein
MTLADGHIILFTVVIAAVSTLCILPFGLALAWWLAKSEWPGKSLVETFISLPLVMPPVATGLMLLELLGRRGPVGGWLHSVFDVDIAFTWRAVLAATAVMSFPLLVRAVRLGFEQVGEEHEDAARVEGASGVRFFWHVVLPLSSRAIVAGLIQAYARALGEFGATIMVAGNIPGRTTTLSLAIYQHVQLGNDAAAYRLLAVSVALAFAAIWFSERLLLANVSRKSEKVCKKPPIIGSFRACPSEDRKKVHDQNGESGFR